MEKKGSIVLGGVGLVLMYLFSQMLVIKPESIGFVDGIIFSWAVKSSIGARYTEFANTLSLSFVAFVLSFFIFQKNRNKIFYGIVFLTIVKWAVEIFYVARLLEGNVEVKVWAIVVFFVGTLIAYGNLIATTVPVAEDTESSQTPSESQSGNEAPAGGEKT